VLVGAARSRARYTVERDTRIEETSISADHGGLHRHPPLRSGCEYSGLLLDILVAQASRNEFVNTNVVARRCDVGGHTAVPFTVVIDTTHAVVSSSYVMKPFTIRIRRPGLYTTDGSVGVPFGQLTR
jgi:hypothetical protein